VCVCVGLSLDMKIKEVYESMNLYDQFCEEDLRRSSLTVNTAAFSCVKDYGNLKLRFV
jgi:hypothetical protein